MALNAGIPLFGFPRPRRATFPIPRKTVAQQDGKAQHRTIARLVKLRMLCHVARRRSKGILLSRATLRRPPYAGILRLGAALGRPLRDQTFPHPFGRRYALRPVPLLLPSFPPALAAHRWRVLSVACATLPLAGRPSADVRSYPGHGAENWVRLTRTISVASERTSPPCGTRHDAGLACRPMPALWRARVAGLTESRPAATAPSPPFCATPQGQQRALPPRLTTTATGANGRCAGPNCMYTDNFLTLAGTKARISRSSCKYPRATARRRVAAVKRECA